MPADVDRALDCLFDTLKAHGRNFSPAFWETICVQILYPIFAILRAKSDVRFRSAEEMSVWLSTTLISALREMVDLYTTYFTVMQRYLDGLLDILVACICQGKSSASARTLSRMQLTMQKMIHWLVLAHPVSSNCSRATCASCRPRNGRASFRPLCSCSGQPLLDSCLTRN